MIDYGWIITKEFDAVKSGEKSSVGTVGPSGITEDVQARLQKGEGTKFRLYDDDGELYAEGLQISDGGEDGEFAPLDDFGMPNWGCTEIKQLLNGEWKTV